MGKAQALFKGAKTKLATTFSMFKRQPPFQHPGTNILTYQEREIASDDSATEQPEQPVQQNADVVLGEPRSALRYVITNYMDGSSKADYDTESGSAGHQSQEGRMRAEDNDAFHPLDSDVTFTKLSDAPDSEESVTTSGATTGLVNIAEGPDMSGEGSDPLDWTLLVHPTLRHRHRRSLSDFVEARIFEPHPTRTDEGRVVSISDALPPTRQPSSGNSSGDTFGRSRNRGPDDGVAPSGVSNLFVNRQPTPEQRDPIVTILEDLNNETPARWSADYDQFSSDGKQRKVEQTSPGNFSLQPRDYRLKTPPQRGGPELNVRKHREGHRSAAAANARVPEDTETLPAGDVGVNEENVRFIQPVIFQPGTAILDAQTAMETIHGSFWQLDVALRQLHRENEGHQQNVRVVMERNRLLEQELDRALATVRARDAELERLRGAIDIASQTLRAAQLPHQTQQNGQAGGAPPQTPWNQMIPEYGDTTGSVDAGASITPQDSGNEPRSEVHHQEQEPAYGEEFLFDADDESSVPVDTPPSSTPQNSSGQDESVVHHQVPERAYGMDFVDDASETSDMYGGGDSGRGDEKLDDGNEGAGYDEDEGEDEGDAATGTPLSSAPEAVEQGGNQEVASGSWPRTWSIPGLPW